LIDYFAIALTHGLLALAAWRLLWRDDLDRENGDEAKPHKPWLKGRRTGGGKTSKQAGGDA
jgi:hypothetical protein